MEFGPVRVAQKNSMYLSQILVIFSIARFWLNILYAKVSVRNIKEGIFRGNIFRKKKKTGIPLSFVEMIGENISETSCVINSFIHLVCMVMVSFLWFLFYWGRCPASVQLQELEVVASLGPLWLYQCPYQVGAFRKVLKGEPTRLPPWPWMSPGSLVGVERHSSIMYLLRDLTPSGGDQHIGLCRVLYWHLTTENKPLFFPGSS